MSDLWIAFRKPQKQARMRLFCFPYAGGSASVYRTWQDDVPPEIEVCPVQLPGRERRFREKPFTRVDLLAEELHKALVHLLDLPYAFFGHSMGAIVGYETAHRLVEAGHAAPVHLLVSARRAPQVPDHDEPYYNLPEPELREKLREINGTPAEVLANAELMELMLPLVRADFELNDTYVYTDRPLPSWPVTAFGGLLDPEVDHEHLEAWKEITRGPFRVRMFEGDHFFLHEGRKPLIQAVLEDLLPRLPRG